jgi:hypothetical protein
MFMGCGIRAVSCVVMLWQYGKNIVCSYINYFPSPYIINKCNVSQQSSINKIHAEDLSLLRWLYQYDRSASLQE